LRRAAIALAFLLAARLTAALPAGVPAQPSEPVTDLAGLFSEGAKASVDQRLRALWDQGKGPAQIAVLTLPSLEGRDIESVSIEVARGWALGKAGLDNGVLLIMAAAEHRLRIEVGTHLEGTLTDIQCSRIINDRMVPAMRAGDPDEALRQGVDGLLLILDPAASTPGGASQMAPGDARSARPRHGGPVSFSGRFGLLGLALLGGLALYSAFNWSYARKDVEQGLGMTRAPWNWPLIEIWLILLFLGLLLRMLWRSGARARWSGGGGGGGGFGGFSGGGGGFSGGGASGSW
jgi:uncharacterized protein